ncbi:hypothetical protein B5807_11811 [Epicoccum nigrum]|uniref:Zn(2)-C6 fungal-type domain-containing protein n=1 Tax=Epicoccum nigrum TaxID=105696 RepID=A0A1Y2LHN5_EPING|nr:hypothetical protein B5807_11811 [Epicoccum nigrum]
MNTGRRQTQRQRLSIACDSCRERKRKCNGSRPCGMCVGYGYECSYRSTPRSRRSQRDASQSEASTQPGQLQTRRQGQAGPNSEQNQDLPLSGQNGQPSYLRSVESNSGAAFVRLLTSTLENSSQSSSPLRMLAWNLFLGERQVEPSPNPHAKSILDLLNKAEIDTLVDTYFRKFHPCYGFVDRRIISRVVTRDWFRKPIASDEALVCGIAAIGSLFSNEKDLAKEYSLATLAKRLLDPSTAGPPSLYLATAWLLRTVYLRLTAKPEEAWSASCTTLHVIDAAESMSSSGHNTPPQAQDSPDMRRSLIGVAQHLNIWLSYDLGRSRVVLPNLVAFPLAVRPGEYTAELLGLLPYSEVLDPNNKLGSDSLLATLVEVLGRSHTEPPSILAQCNLALCIYRRLHPSGFNIAESVRTRLFAQMRKSVDAVHLAIAQQLPWHHVANIPFQILCMLLFIDTAQSFELIGDALTCIVAVNDAYHTEATREAATAAYTLLQLHRQRREAEIQNHTNMLSLYPSLDPQVQQSHGELLSGDGLQDSWWFNEFVSQADLADMGVDFTSLR